MRILGQRRSEYQVAKKKKTTNQKKSVVVVFGGHASWLREMKQRFPDVRFIGKDLLPNENLIRNADEVWIRLIALSHSYFYKIIDEIRRRNKPIRYFTNAGVNRCSEQLIQAGI